MGTICIHPVSKMVDGLAATAPWKDVRPRIDGGGNRILKLEWSMVEFRTDDLGLGRRVSLFKDIDFFAGEGWAQVGTGPRFDAMQTPAEEWPCNRGRQHRAFPNARSGIPWRTG